METIEGCVPDFSQCTDYKSVLAAFVRSASIIMCEHVLIHRGREFSITSLELYLKISSEHLVWSDPALDGSPEQSESGTWYVMTRKGSRYWRLDITAGNKAKGIKCGMLVRQLDGNGGIQPGPNTALKRLVSGGAAGSTPQTLMLSGVEEIFGKKIDGSDGSPLILRRRVQRLEVALALGKRFNIPNDKRYIEINGQRLPDPELRLSPWRRYSEDKQVAGMEF